MDLVKRKQKVLIGQKRIVVAELQVARLYKEELEREGSSTYEVDIYIGDLGQQIKTLTKQLAETK